MKKIVLRDSYDDSFYAIFEIEKKKYLSDAIKYETDLREKGEEYASDFEMIIDYLDEHKIDYKCYILDELPSIDF